MIDIKFLQKNILDLSVIQKTRNTEYTEWLKNFLTISTAILAVLISLKFEKSKTLQERFFYLSTILLSGIGIISGVIVLYSYVELENQALKKKKEQVFSLQNGEKIEEVVNINMPTIYNIISYLCHVSLFMALISLVIYGFVSEL